MAHVKGMIKTNVELSPEQIDLHGLPGVPAEVYGHGDGWTIKNQPNYFSGRVVTHHAKKTKYGKTSWNVINTPEDAIVRLREIDHSITDEAERIAGHYDPQTHERVPGEINAVEDLRSGLMKWRDLSQEERDELRDTPAELANPRARAINPLNVDAGDRAARMARLRDSKGRDNPGAMLAISVSLPDLLAARFEELELEVRAVNNRRKGRLLKWLVDDDRAVATASRHLDRLATEQKDETLGDLRGALYHVRFLNEPFNDMAREVHQTGGKVADPEVVKTAQEGLRFHTQKQYLALPFRKIINPTQEKLTDNLAAKQEEILPELAERLERLEGFNMGGAYQSLLGRLKPLVIDVGTALETGDVSTAQRLAKRFRFLLAYHCLPGRDDPEQVRWYYHRF